MNSCSAPFDKALAVLCEFKSKNMQQSVFDENQFYGRDIKSTHAKSQSVEHLTSNQRDAFLFFDALPSYQRANCKLFGIQMPSSGQRKFLCCSYDQYLANFHSIDKKKRHHYEVIRDGFPCRLYFDLEYPVKPNADVDGNNLTRSWLALTAWKIHQFFGITLGTEHFVVLDSCTDKKFSKHVTVNIPCPLEKAVRQGLTGELRTECLFENNIVVGQFVESMLLDIMEEKLGERKVKEPYRKFWVKNEDGGSQFFVDAGVYTRNRQFRVYGSSKHKKNKNLTLDMVDKNMYANFLPVQGKKQKQQREIMIKEIFDKSFVVPTDLFPCLDAKSKSLAAGSPLCKESESVPPLSPSTNTNTNAGEMNWNAQHVSPTPTGRKQKRKRHSPQVHSTSSPSGIAAGSNLKEKCESPILPQDKKVRLPSASPLFSPDEGYGSERSESSVASASSEYSVQDKNQLARIYDPLEFNDQYACLVLPRGARGEGFITTFSSNDNSLSSSTSTKENMQNMQEQRVDSIPVLSFYHSCVGAGTGVLSSSSASNPNRLHASQQSSRSQLASQLSSTQKSQNQGIIGGAPLGTTNLLQVSISLSLRLKGLFLYNVGILCNVEWLIRQIWCFSITLA